MRVHEAPADDELSRIAAEQAALRRVATLVAAGVGEPELLSAATYEIGRLFDAQRAATMRWEGDTIRVIGDWNEDTGQMRGTGRTYAYGGDTITARVVETMGPARINSLDDLTSDFAPRAVAAARPERDDRRADHRRRRDLGARDGVACPARSVSGRCRAPARATSRRSSRWRSRMPTRVARRPSSSPSNPRCGGSRR